MHDVSERVEAALAVALGRINDALLADTPDRLAALEAARIAARADVDAMFAELAAGGNRHTRRAMKPFKHKCLKVIELQVAKARHAAADERAARDVWADALD